MWESLPFKGWMLAYCWTYHIVCSSVYLLAHDSWVSGYKSCCVIIDCGNTDISLRPCFQFFWAYMISPLDFHCWQLFDRNSWENLFLAYESFQSIVRRVWEEGEGILVLWTCTFLHLILSKPVEWFCRSFLSSSPLWKCPHRHRGVFKSSRCFSSISLTVGL